MNGEGPPNPLPTMNALRALLLKSGANINAQNSQGATPLIFAAMGGNQTGVAFLLDNGADKNVLAEIAGGNKRDAARIAELAGFPEIATVIRGHKSQ